MHTVKKKRLVVSRLTPPPPPLLSPTDTASSLTGLAYLLIRRSSKKKSAYKYIRKNRGREGGPEAIVLQHLSILPVSVRCPSPCLIRGGNNSVSRSCCTNASPLPCLPHRLTQFIGPFIDHRQGFLSLCPPIFAFHTRTTILAMLRSTRLLTHYQKLQKSKK